MAKYNNPDGVDEALKWYKGNTTIICACGTQPTTAAQATASTYALGTLAYATASFTIAAGDAAVVTIGGAVVSRTIKSLNVLTAKELDWMQATINGVDNLPTDELTRIRTDLEDVMLPDTGVILTGTIVIDGMGGNTTTWGTTYAGVHCRMDYVKGVKPVIGGMLQPFTGFMLTVPYDTPLTTNNRFEYGGEQYNVINVTSGSWMIDKRSELEKV